MLIEVSAVGRSRHKSKHHRPEVPGHLKVISSFLPLKERNACLELGLVVAEGRSHPDII